VRLDREARSPIIGVSAVMFESKNVKTIRIIAIIDCVREPGHQVTAHVSVDKSPTFGCFEDNRDGLVDLAKKLDAQCCYTAFVISRCLD
jgi:hypothetical protein